MGRKALSIAVVVAASALLANDVQAGWGHWGGSYGSYGGYGCAGACVGTSAYYGGSAGYAYAGWGHRPRLGGRIHAHWAAHRARKMARRAYRAAYAYGGGCWGGCVGGGYASRGAWGCVGSGCWGSGYASTGYGCGGGYACAGYGCTGYATTAWSTASSCDCGAHPVVDCPSCGGGEISTVPMDEGTIPMDEGTIMENESIIESAPIEGESARSSAGSDRGVLTVQVPSDARVFVNGAETRSVGNERRYVSRGLSKGYSYRYEVRAITERNGRKLEQTRVATLRAGQMANLGFDFTQPEPVETRLTLHVPEDAKVLLSGTETDATGNIRKFATTRIESGKQWADYLVEVTVERDGQTLTKHQRVSLSGGDRKELRFDFEPNGIGRLALMA